MEKHIEVINTLSRALIAAKDHLEYCGYGDSWERSCAVEQGLEQQIFDALADANSFVQSQRG